MESWADHVSVDVVSTDNDGGASMVRRRPETALEAGEAHVHRVQRVGGKVVFSRDKSLARPYLEGGREWAHDSELFRCLRD